MHLSPGEKQQAVEWYQARIPVPEIAKRLGCSKVSVYQVLKSQGVTRSHSQAQAIRVNRVVGPLPQDPTPEEIKERSAKIRKHWSEEEHHERAGAFGPVPYEVPVVRLEDWSP